MGDETDQTFLYQFGYIIVLNNGCGRWVNNHKRKGAEVRKSVLIQSDHQISKDPDSSSINRKDGK